MEGVDSGKPSFGGKEIFEIDTDQQDLGSCIQSEVSMGQNHATYPNLSSTPRKWTKIERPQNLSIEITESLLAVGADHKRTNTVALDSIEEEASGSGK